MAKNNIIESPTINTIGKGTSIKGDIKSNGDFRIDGSLHGSIQSDGKIVVGSTGFIEGEIICQNADISGTVKANIRAKDLLSLKSTCHVDGAIIADKLAIEPGAKFSGTCSMDQREKSQQNSKVVNESVREKEKVIG
jgi:cytoskeletal protein CcmA (bactofilin family)